MYQPKAEDYKWVKGRIKRALNRCAKISRSMNKSRNEQALSPGKVFIDLHSSRRKWLEGRA